jgi:probable metal-binding protein
MGESIHGHEIMRLVHEANPPLTPGRLREAVERRFGRDARFHACAGGGMTLDDLLVFLKDRGKVIEVDGVLRTDIGQMCDHEEPA